MANWNKLDVETMNLILDLNKRDVDSYTIAGIVKLSLSTVQRVMNGCYDKNATYVGNKHQKNQSKQPVVVAEQNDAPEQKEVDDWGWLKDAAAKMLYEQCLINDRLKQIINELT